MKITNKNLSIVAWIIAGLYLVNMFINIESGAVFVITQLLAAATQGVIAYAMSRDQNDKMTRIMVIVFAIVNLSLPIGILAILVLMRRKGKDVMKLWYLPAVVAVGVYVISIALTIQYITVFNIFWYLVNIVNLLVLGYWMVKELGEMNN